LQVQALHRAPFFTREAFPLLQRRPQKVSEAPALHRPHAVRELFHDRDFPDPVALPRMDVGTVDCDNSVRRSNLAAAAFRADAGSQSVKGIVAVSFSVMKILQRIGKYEIPMLP
jgi:hypothetical protein